MMFDDAISPWGRQNWKNPNGLMDLGPWFSKPSDLVHVFICFPWFSELPTVDDPVTVGDTPRRSLSSIWEAYLFAGAVGMMPLEVASQHLGLSPKKLRPTRS